VSSFRYIFTGVVLVRVIAKDAFKGPYTIPRRKGKLAGNSAALSTTLACI
jgi:hypothetical protein